jgi:hypothetical protein
MEGSLVAYKVFTNGSVLNASEINENLMNQSVMVFSNSTARAAALTAPVEGMLTWLQDTNKYENYNGTAWVALGSSPILQIVSVTKADTFSVASTSMTNMTGLTASITPSSSSSKVLVILSLGSIDSNADNLISGDVTRAGTAIGIGDTAGSRIRSGWNVVPNGGNRNHSVSYSFLDSPATTSSTAYQARVRTNAGTAFLNRSSGETDSSTFSRSVSTITLMEVAG